MVNKKKTGKKLTALILSFAIVLSLIPVGLFTVFAVNNECMAVKVNETKVYFYGVKTLKVEDNKVTYTGGTENAAVVYVDGQAADDAQVEKSARTVTFDKSWLESQTAWVAVQCDNSVDVDASEPDSVAVDEVGPTFSEGSVTGNPEEWTKDNVTLTLEATDDGTGVAAYKMNDGAWQTKYDESGAENPDFNKFTVEENGDYTFYAKDAVGNESAVTTDCAVKVEKIDKTAPKVKTEVKDWTADNKVIVVTAANEENESGVKAYAMDSTADEAWKESKEFEVLDNKIHTFYVKDKVGNIGETTVKLSDHDTEAPHINSVSIYYDYKGEKEELVAEYTTDENGKLTTESIKALNSSKLYKYTLVVDAADNASGVARYYLGESQSDKGVFTINSTTGNESEFFDIKVVDNCENKTETSFEVKDDADTPNVSTNAEKVDKKTSSPVEVKISADDKTGISEYILDGNSITETIVEISNSNTHKITVKDNAVPANESSVEFQLKNYNDKKPTFGEVKWNKEWTNKAVTFTIPVRSINEAGTEFKIKECHDETLKTNENTEIINEERCVKVTVKDCLSHTIKVTDESGASNTINIKATNYDSNAPVLERVTFEQKNAGVLAKLANKLTFGRFFNKTLEITVNAKDLNNDISNVSGISEAEFVFENSESKKTYVVENACDIGNSQDAEIKFEVKQGELPENFKGTAKVVLTDFAGNKSETSVDTKNSNMGELAENAPDYNFMIENDAPKIGNPYADEGVLNVDGSKYYSSKSNFDFKVDVNDIFKNKVCSGVAEVVVKSGDTVLYSKEYQSSKLEEVTEIFSVNCKDKTLTVKDSEADSKLQETDLEKSNLWNNGIVNISVQTCDNAGNVSEIKTFTLHLDVTAPVISKFQFNSKNSNKEGDEETVNAQIKPYGFFFKETVDVTVTASDVKVYNGENVALTGVKEIHLFLEDKDGTKFIPLKDENGNYSTLQKINSNTTELVETFSLDEKEKKFTFTVPADFKGQIYAYAVDELGNSSKNNETLNRPQESVNDKKEPLYTMSDYWFHPDGAVVESADKHKKDYSSIDIIPAKTAYTQNNKGVAIDTNYISGDIQDNELDYVKNVGNKKVPLYKTKTTFGVNVIDSYSGIKKVKYTLYEGKKTTCHTISVDNNGNIVDASSGDISTKNTDKNKKSEEVWSVTGKVNDRDGNLVTAINSTVTVDGNYNDMTLLVELTDRAGHTSYDYYTFGIDQTPAKVTVSYDNNNVDSKYNNFFTKARKATVVIEERNFNDESVVWKYSNEEGADGKKKGPKVKTYNSTNGDNNSYTYTIDFVDDGVYYFAVSYTDRAGNKTYANKKEQTESVKIAEKTIVPYEFVIDKTKPKISISYNNNQLLNGMYFDSARTATITVVEHNFDKIRIDSNIKITALTEEGGKALSQPKKSKWTSKGDVHTATITYTQDGYYKFAVSMTDKSGNKNKGISWASSTKAKDEFVIDKTKPIIKIKNGSKGADLSGTSHGKDSSVTPYISLEDINFDSSNYTITLSRVVNYGKKESGVEKQFIKPLSTDKHGGSSLSNNFEFIKKNDGIYTLDIKLTDKAGNSDSSTAVFTVNRFGSIYSIEYMPGYDSNGNYNADYSYIRSLDKDIVITEYNPSKLSSHIVNIFKNGNLRTLSKDDYTVKSTHASGADWYEYKYTISKSVFTEDIYKVSLVSKDSVGHEMNNTYSEFTVDKTAPSILTAGNIFDKESYKLADKFTLIIADNSLGEEEISTSGIKAVEISYAGKSYLFVPKDFVNGNQISFTYKELLDKLGISSDSSTFRQNLKVTVTDNAGNVLSTDTQEYQEYYEEQSGSKPQFTVTVSDNWIVLQFGKQWVRWTLLGVGVALVAAIVLIIVFAKRRKKDDEEASAQ